MRAGGRIDVTRAPSGLDWDRKTAFMAGVRRAARRGEDRPCPRIGSAAHRCASGAAKEARARRPAGVRCGPRSPPGDRLEQSGERRLSHRWHGSFSRPGSHTFSTTGFAVGPLDGVGRGSRLRAGASRPAQMHAYRRRCADCSTNVRSLCAARRLSRQVITTERPHPTGGSCPREGHRNGNTFGSPFRVVPCFPWSRIFLRLGRAVYLTGNSGSVVG